MEKDLIQLERALRSLRKPSLSSDVKNRMRQDMLLRMSNPIAVDVRYPSLERLRLRIKKVSKITEPSSVFKAKVKENILALIEGKRRGFRFFTVLGRNWQKVLATFMVGIMSLTSFTVYFADIPVTKAAKKTAFQELYGDVEVIRDGQSIEAFKYMQLREGDLIITGENGIAIVRYFDDSVSRLSPLTELKMQRLYQDKQIKSKTEIELELTKGRVWNQVVNLVGDQSSFEVSVSDIKARVSKKASFDISYCNDEKKVAVAVFENKIEVSVPEKKKQNKKVVVEGYSVEFNDDESVESKIDVGTKEDEVWIKVNKAEDKQYRKEVDKEKEDETKIDAGVLPSDPLYSAKKINESTKLLMTTDELEKNKIKVDIAVKRLTEAGALLADGDEESAKELLDEFSESIKEISAKIDDSSELRDYVRTSLNDEEKDLSTVLPGQKRYMAKEALRDAKLLLAITDDEKGNASLESATQKVIEAKELFNEDKQEEAQDTLLEAAKGIVTVDSATSEQKEDALSTVRVLKDAVEDNTDVAPEIKLIIDATEDSLEESSKDALESDSAVIVDVNGESTIQLKAMQE